ncbi:C40 family peptidase [Tessaracoccus flavus]|uniref:Uncharacterized protein n=1 Tax=Tessaracoccus flavus TaxID=1610493 RepID=A0A1Q2CD69_9ACTN|nr:C40 family peptidase [Tessaracoccus flavus]AQP44041.1 hypothetical protein RPIT_03770 [Tessaracoccus flavus]SDY32967.1 Cell wall-associated hydrolase, NlpC family [Tessaracoccus flavus]
MNRARLALASAVAAALLVTSGAVAQADPEAVERARQELASIQQQASAIDQEIIEASERAQDAEATLKHLSADLAAQEGKVATLTSELGDVATLQMHTDSISLTAQLLTSGSSDSFLSGLATMQSELNRANAGIQQLQLDQARLTTLREDAAAAEATLRAERDKAVALAEEFDAKEAEAERVYERLSEEERQRLAAIEAERQRIADEQQRQAEQQQREAEQREREAQAGSTSRSRDTASAQPSASATEAAKKDEPAPAAESGGSDRAQRAVQAALAQVGKRYVWGTSGPNTFDCSGLTSYAYRQVGINLTRSSRAQWSSVGRKVSKSELRPGDLVFYYSPVSHVGLYIGNGKIVDAANPRSGIRVTSLNSMPFTGARRVVG